MKKVLSAVLAGALALGMGVAAFAAPTVYNPSYSDVDLSDVAGYASGYSLYSGIDGGTVSGYGPYTYDWGDQYAQDKPKLEINLWTYMFDGINDADSKTNVYYAINLNNLTRLGMSSTTITDIKSKGTNALRITALDAAIDDLIDASGDKLITGNIYLSSLKFGGASTIGEKEAVMQKWYRVSGLITTTSAALESSGELLEATLDAKDGFIFFYVASAPNVTSIIADTSTTTYNRTLTASEIRNSKIALKTSVRGDSKLIKKLELDRSAGKVVLELVDEFVSVKEADLEMTVYLTFDGKYDTDDHLTILATLKNYEIEVYANYDYVDISDGRILVTEEFNPAISVYIGNGVTVDTKLFNGKKYYGITTRDPDEADTIVFRQYPDVDNVVTLKTIGFSNTGDVVRFDTDSYGYYVYDKDMNYLGKADEKLPFSAKYYLANKKLETETTAEPEPVEEDDDDDVPAPVVSNPSTGGDAAAPNVNLNPGTGR